MRAIGIDIGTTTICAIVMESITGEVLDTVTMENNSFIPGNNTWERLQNPATILNIVEAIVENLVNKYAPIVCIGLTGQMHGIVYIDNKGNSVSPLYTWQDGRGDTDFKDGLSYVEYLSSKTGYKLATGYGVATHFYNTFNGIVPEAAHKFCTIHDYVAMRLCGRVKPLIHTSDAASLGLFDVENNKFDTDTIRTAGMDINFFPDVTSKIELIGATKKSIPVSVGIGDNQASFLGSVQNNEECMLVNIGTGSQISLFADKKTACPNIEARPLADGGFILVGSSLCGGRSYAILEKFFNSFMCAATGTKPVKLYDVMDKLALEFEGIDNPLEISTKFCGTRENPTLRGGIANIGIDNFTPQHVIIGVLTGIVKELYDKYEVVLPFLSTKPAKLVGSGNGIRMNRPLQRIIAKMFDMPLRIPELAEEASFGAALFALTAAGCFANIGEAQKIIRYNSL